MIYVLPGASFEATLSGAPTGLVGTIGVRLVDGLGATTQARTTTAIVESPASSGIYTATRTAPTTAGTYVVVWDTGTVSPSTTAAEELVVTVSMPDPFTPSGDCFISVADLGTFIGQDLTGDDKAQMCVDAACAAVRTFTEQYISEVTDEEIVLDGTGTDALLLPQVPVIDVTAVTENATALVVGDDYGLNGNGVLLRTPTVTDEGTYITTWFKGRQNITITYSHGYADADLPRDVRIVALQMAARLFQQSGLAVSEESLGAYSIRYANTTTATDFTKNEERILRRYKQSR